MRIRGTSVRRAGAALEHGPASARGRWNHRAGALLRVEAEHGVGLGEASPLPGFSPETLEEAAEALQSIDPAVWRGFTGDSWGAVRRFAADSIPPSAPSARFAVEAALGDLVARARGVALWELLGGRPGRRLPLAGVITSPELVEALAQAEVLVSQGLGTLKVKVGRPGAFDDEVALCRAIRARWPDVHLRADANGTFEPEGVVAQVAALAEAGVCLVEEPAPPETLVGCPPLAAPAAQDESLRSGMRDDVPAYAAVVLKPTLLGGLGACLDVARAAAARGRTVLVSHTFDGPVALTAASHLALAVGSEGWAQGLARHAALLAYPAAELPLHDGAAIVARDVPGLGMVGAAP